MLSLKTSPSPFPELTPLPALVAAVAHIDAIEAERKRLESVSAEIRADVVRADEAHTAASQRLGDLETAQIIAGHDTRSPGPSEAALQEARAELERTADELKRLRRAADSLAPRFIALDDDLVAAVGPMGTAHSEFETAALAHCRAEIIAACPPLARALRLYSAVGHAFGWRLGDLSEYRIPNLGRGVAILSGGTYTVEIAPDEIVHEILHASWREDLVLTEVNARIAPLAGAKRAMKIRTDAIARKRAQLAVPAAPKPPAPRPLAPPQETITDDQWRAERAAVAEAARIYPKFDPSAHTFHGLRGRGID